MLAKKAAFPKSVPGPLFGFGADKMQSPTKEFAMVFRNHLHLLITKMGYKMHLKSSQNNACSALLNHDCCFYAFLFVSGGELYSGTVADFSGSDALIIRDHLRTDRLEQTATRHPEGAIPPR